VQAGKPQGFGIQTLSDGVKVEADWKNGKAIIGVVYFGNGDVY
jgi:hypothetical protein